MEHIKYSFRGLWIILKLLLIVTAVTYFSLSSVGFPVYVVKKVPVLIMIYAPGFVFDVVLLLYFIYNLGKSFYEDD